MKNTFASWIWSFKVVVRSYPSVVVLAALIAFWVFAAYQWLGLPESSGLVLALAFVWAAVQLLVTVAILSGTVQGATQAATAERDRLLLLDLVWTGLTHRRRFWGALLLCVVSSVVVGLLWAGFTWINDHALEVASFLTFHSQKPVSYVLVRKIYQVVEGLMWIALGGFLLSFGIALFMHGWRGARKQAGRLLARCSVRSPFVAGLLSVVVFGGAAHLLAHWRPVVPAGFWDYTQMAVRFALVPILLAAGWLLWLLSLARLNLRVIAPSVTVETSPPKRD
jgi:hypothetical protein